MNLRPVDEARGLGADILDCGGGTRDTAGYRTRVDTITVDLASTGSTQGEIAEGDTIVNIEHVIGGLGYDTLLGNERDNTMVGNGGETS